MHAERISAHDKKHAERTLCSIDERFARNVDARNFARPSQVRLTRFDRILGQETERRRGV
jgi:hypothetical protein